MKIEGTQAKQKGTKLLLVLSVLASYIVALFPLAYYTNKNFSYISVKEIWLSLALVSAHWLLVFLISLFGFRAWSKASFATMLIILPLSLFHTILNVVKRFMPTVYYWHGIIVLIIAIGLLWYLIHYFVKEDVARKLCLIFGAVIFVLLLVNITPSVVSKIQEKRQLKQRMDSVATQGSITGHKTDNTQDYLPNIYLFIFDEYAGHKSLERYTGFDNQKFYDDLSQLGFNVSKGSLGYTISTRIEIPNLMNLDTVVTESTDQAKDQMMKSPVLFNTLIDLGYDINLINDQKFISTPSSYFKYVFNPTNDFQRSESLMSLMIDRSAYYPLLKTIVGNRMQEVFGMFQYGAESSELQESGLFTFAYLSFPHLPWFVDEHGNKVDENDQMNWDDTNIYLGQLKYSSKLILELVNKILANDPESCIILLSDHGFRLPEMQRKYHGIEAEDKVLEEYYMRNILQAVYYFGEQMDFDGYSGINVLRTILDNLFSLNLGLIEEAR